MQQVLVIDDDMVSRRTVEKYLGDTCDTEFAFDGESGLVRARELKPDLILLDVEMPGMNGYVVCEKLKQDDITRDIPVIFLSGRQSAREKLLGYEAGADDFLVKPFEPEILLTKIKLLHENRKRHDQLLLEKREAQTTAISAMTDSSELGQILQFVEKNLFIPGYTALAKAMFSVTTNMGLNCCLIFRVGSETMFYSSDGEERPLEKDIMLRLTDEGRFYDFGCRTQINYLFVSLLIKNMPLDDRDRYGRIKDVLPFLLGCSDAKVQLIKTRNDVVNQVMSLSGTMDLIRSNLGEQAEYLQDSQEAAVKILRNLLNELDARIPDMGLEDDQQEYLLSRLDQAVVDASEKIDSSLYTQRGFAGVLKLLQHVIDRQNEILKDDTEMYDRLLCKDSEEHMEEVTDVELF